MNVILYTYIVRYIFKKSIAAYSSYHSEPELVTLLINNTDMVIKSRSMPEFRTPPPPLLKTPTNRKKFNKESANKIRYDLTGRRNSFSPAIENNLNDIYGLNPTISDNSTLNKQPSKISASVVSLNPNKSEKPVSNNKIIKQPIVKFSKQAAQRFKLSLKLETIEETESNDDISP